MSTPDVTSPREVLITSTPPSASLIAKLENGKSESCCNNEPRPKVAHASEGAWLCRHVAVRVCCPIIFARNKKNN